MKQIKKRPFRFSDNNGISVEKTRQLIWNFYSGNLHCESLIVLIQEMNYTIIQKLLQTNSITRNKLPAKIQ
jgi:hypothetical protein